MEQMQALQEERWFFFFFCFRIKLGLLTLPLSCLHIHKHQAPYPQMVPCDDMEGQGYWLCSSHCSSCLSIVSVHLFWLCLLYLLGAVCNLLLHAVPPLWMFRSTLPVLHFLIWVSYGPAHRYLSCANPGAVNTHYSPKPFYLAVLSGVPMLTFPFSLHLCQLQVHYSSL